MWWETGGDVGVGRWLLRGDDDEGQEDGEATERWCRHG